MIVPEGFAAVTPYLFIDDPDAYARFLGVAFGGRELARSTDPHGRIANCQVRIATATLVLSEASDGFPPSRVAFHQHGRFLGPKSESTRSTHERSPFPSPLLRVARCVWGSLGVTKVVNRQQVPGAHPCVVLSRNA